MLKQNIQTGQITLCCMGLLKFIETEDYEVVGRADVYPDLLNNYNGLIIEYCPFCGKALNEEREEKKRNARRI